MVIDVLEREKGVFREIEGRVLRKKMNTFRLITDRGGVHGPSVVSSGPSLFPFSILEPSRTMGRHHEVSVEVLKASYH